LFKPCGINETLKVYVVQWHGGISGAQNAGVVMCYQLPSGCCQLAMLALYKE
jgi:hypothetical protein